MHKKSYPSYPKVVFGIPGGWYGNDPGWSRPGIGNVAVDPVYADQAGAWLRERGRIIGQPRPAPYGGVMIRYRIRLVQTGGVR